VRWLRNTEQPEPNPFAGDAEQPEPNPFAGDAEQPESNPFAGDADRLPLPVCCIGIATEFLQRSHAIHNGFEQQLLRQRQCR